VQGLANVMERRKGKLPDRHGRAGGRCIVSSLRVKRGHIAWYLTMLSPAPINIDGHAGACEQDRAWTMR